ncbi:collagenase-like [Plodia interpunctella]|uniref:collagenase-like n=1 Tax=Plodia interpunctella TaxID=58824 RepID=UPI002368EE65|nr:collagenase-like [Plodia interpunctella]
MKLLIILLISTGTFGYYHKDVGIPKAARIKEAEEKGIQRITGGEYTDLGTYPFFAGLVIAVDMNLTSVCGSSLISNTKLITAAHCWNDGENTAMLLEVVLASTKLFSGGTRLGTNDVVAHEDFNIDTLQNDIAIITISSVEFDENLKPINLPTEQSYVGIQCHVVGFGRTGEGNPVTMAQKLSHAMTTVISNEECATIYGDMITDSLICTSGVDGRGPCGGDSGGPVFYGNEDFVVIGVVSFGAVEGCDAGYPTSHTRVSAFLQWINEKM